MVDVKIGGARRQFFFAACPGSHEFTCLRKSAFESACLSSLSLLLSFFKYTTYTAQPLRKLCEYVKKRGVSVDG